MTVGGGKGNGAGSGLSLLVTRLEASAERTHPDAGPATTCLTVGDRLTVEVEISATGSKRVPLALSVPPEFELEQDVVAEEIAPLASTRRSWALVARGVGRGMLQITAGGRMVALPYDVA